MNEALQQCFAFIVHVANNTVAADIKTILVVVVDDDGESLL